MKLYLDFVGGNCWALSQSPEFPFPRVNVCGCPVRLLQEYTEQGYNIELSDAAQLICDNDLRDLLWNHQYFRAEKFVKEYRPTEVPKLPYTD